MISVSNFAYLNRTKCAAVDFGDPESAAKAIFSLRPSRAMGTDGEFFDPNYLLVDAKRHLVIHLNWGKVSVASVDEFEESLATAVKNALAEASLESVRQGVGSGWR